MKRWSPLVALLLAGCAAPALLSESTVTSVPDLVRLDSVGEDEPAKISTLHGDATHACNVVQVRGAVKPHLHRHSHEIVCVISGEGRLRLGEKEFHLSAGDVVFVARGTVHAFESTGAEPAVVLSVFAPGFVEGDRIFVKE
jgi:quercetin dioxygenase-like cupin family protein